MIKIEKVIFVMIAICIETGIIAICKAVDKDWSTTIAVMIILALAMILTYLVIKDTEF